MKIIEKMAEDFIKKLGPGGPSEEFEAFQAGFRAAREMAAEINEGSGEAYNPGPECIRALGEQELEESKSGAI